MNLFRLSPLLLLLAVTACKKIISTEPVNPIEVTPPIPTSFEGLIVDESRQPIVDATVLCSGKTTTTDADGHFIFPDVVVDTNAVVVSVKKNGYVQGFRTLMARAHSQQYLEVTLKAKDLTTSFSGTAMGNIGFTGVNVVFSPNQILDAANKAYKGTVSVAVDYVAPSDANLATRMAGDLRGIDNSGNAVGLIPYGQIAVDLQDTSHAVLHPDAAHLVNLTIAIPGPYRASAPAQIGLFYLDTISGLWKQETLGYKQGNNYTGNIRQGTRWMFATTYSQVTLDANIYQSTGMPVSNLLTTIATKMDFIPAFGYTNATGHFIGKVAVNQPLILTLTDHCGHIVFQKEIGPYSANSTIETLQTDNLVLCKP